MLFAGIFFAKNSYSQWQPSWNVGIGLGAIRGINEALAQSINPQFTINGLWRNGLAPHLSLEGGIGFGKISSPNQGGYSEYSTNLIPIDLRIRYAPLEEIRWQPYLYAGIGLLSYSVTSAPPNASPDAKLSGTTEFLPLGIGLYHPLDKNFAVDCQVGVNPSLSDDLNPVHDNRNDAYWSFRIGIMYTFGNNQPQSADEFDFGSRGTSQVFGNIAFDSGTSRLRPESDPLLVPVLNSLTNHPEIEIQVRAYTDNSGDFNAAMELTQDRAESIKIWLVSRGVSASRISTQGYGPHNPLMPNDTPEHRLMNHRIEIVRMK